MYKFLNPIPLSPFFYFNINSEYLKCKFIDVFFFSEYWGSIGMYKKKAQFRRAFFCEILFVYIISLQSFDKIKSTAYCEGGWLSLLSIGKERR